MIKEFKEFLLRGNLLDLAVAVVIGAAFTAVVAAITKNIITPLIKAIFQHGCQFSGIGIAHMSHRGSIRFHGLISIHLMGP